MSKIIILVSCVSKKVSSPRPARSLYISNWFEKAAHYANRFSDEWFILSAEYGLVLPDQCIKPYDTSLKKMGKDARKCWAEQVFTVLSSYLTSGDTVVFLAGKAYREFLIEPIAHINCKIEIPMERLRIGEQMHWLTQQLQGNNNETP
jgi:cytoplasmic iron level regulating protein YaaA (DUF328/UPF0246 family)